jgi:hypothetical protein
MVTPIYDYLPVVGVVVTRTGALRASRILFK